MVLIHGGGGTAFEEWVRLWVDRGYAAIAMDTCGQIPVGQYGRWFRDEQGGPAGWGGLEQIDQPQTDQWAYHAVADVILAHSLIRSLPEVDAAADGFNGNLLGRLSRLYRCRRGSTFQAGGAGLWLRFHSGDLLGGSIEEA